MQIEFEILRLRKTQRKYKQMLIINAVNLIILQYYTLGYWKMTTVMNEKLAKSYLKTLDDKLMRKIKTMSKKITTQDVIQMIFQILPTRNTTPLQVREALKIIQTNQETIIDNRCQIQYLRKKAELEDQLTASFIKNIMKDQIKIHVPDSMNKTIRRQNSSMILNLPNPALSRYEVSRVELAESRLDDSLFDRSPIGSISKKDHDQSQRYGVCNTSRSKISGLRYERTELSEDMDFEEKQKIKALNKLRKLQKYVFEKQNINKDKSLTKIWNCGVSPSKLRYKQENQNLKVIQSNLVTHLTLLQKYREIPSIQGLVAREQALKKKERSLKQLSQMLNSKQLSLNKKHTQFLKRQKSHKVL